VQLLLGHTKIESTVRYLGIEVDDALAIAEQVDVIYPGRVDVLCPFNQGSYVPQADTPSILNIWVSGAAPRSPGGCRASAEGGMPPREPSLRVSWIDLQGNI
jgi:hypothetical protein